MQKLLTKGIGHTKFKKTELGEIPEKWKMISVNEIGDVKGGKRLPKGHPFTSEKTNYPYLRVVDFKSGTIDKTNLKYISLGDYENIKQYIISSNDVYISIAGTIGLVGIIPKELDGSNLTENAAKECCKYNFNFSLVELLCNSIFLNNHQIQFSFFP
ncbi:MAG: restriction endonuclease subunit S [Methanosarcina barkeri]|nr:restriction endonuclease subunit S [Methanosarcina sp. ERenArc_MAG2]